jgi:segregation and condensation protein B
MDTTNELENEIIDADELSAEEISDEDQISNETADASADEPVSDDAVDTQADDRHKRVELKAPESNDELALIFEATLLAAGEPLGIKQMQAIFDKDSTPDRERCKAALELLSEAYEDRAFHLVEVASGYTLQVKKEFSPGVSRLWEEKPPRYSRAYLETLAIIAYRQPVTRGDIESIRGVAVSSNIIRTLIERNWVKVVGHRDVIGKPAVLGTTKEFLDAFNLTKLSDLPPLSEIKDLDELAKGLPDDVAAEVAAQAAAQQQLELAVGEGDEAAEADVVAEADEAAEADVVAEADEAAEADVVAEADEAAQADEVAETDERTEIDEATEVDAIADIEDAEFAVVESDTELLTDEVD